MINTIIFDLDKTVINSDARTPYLPNGDLDLNTYKALQTRANIFKDKLLPLARVMRQAYKQGFNVVVLTARFMTKADYDYLNFHNLKYHAILSRNGITPDHNNLTDSLYKLKHLQDSNIDVKCAIMYDDNPHVKSTLRKAGLNVQCAIKTNSKLFKLKNPR